ncbi:transglycosylase domain-containing protein [Parasphingopyxis lamellibrachiae]|uniref:Penicillin-binding protein 1A n=1 Tax=Parasphingopyxis lamellibrachiae TaxID=680125 RepID=A0A3D9FJ28_9SPHN|nr:PBP1A family penicillin-binding protein [Parasphingopyxis lamellibrachiae]RED17111.1 penicillin-binding protein 1A [Parasphingopyxis lamellibrachiae]
MAASRASKRGPVWRVTIGLIKFGLYAALLGFVALAVAVGIAMSSLPDFDTLQSSPNGQTVRVRAADGTVIFAMGPSYGQWLRHDEIPEIMRDAMISVEDRRFESHLGVDPIGIARSVWVRMERGRWAQGGSTITQQLARNLFLTNTRTFGRKIREMILALAIERRFTKEQILELYLNRVYFGGGAYGIDAASRRFFGHSARELDLSEAAVVAGLVKAPSRYSPTADAQAAIGRAGVVLDLMVETGHISASEASAAAPDDVSLTPQPRRNSVRYFTDWTLNQLDLLIDETRAPIDVWTTLDLDMQARAVESVRAHTPEGAQAALVSLDRDGAVRAMVGGTDYVTSNYNRAVTAVRQPGSSWKLFVYLAALENGYTPDDRVIDEPVNWNGWQPRNSSGRYSGEMDVRTAFAYSVNTVAAQLGAEVGLHTVANMAQRFGISTPVNTHPSMVLGTSEVRVIDMARAFASVAAHGIAIEPYGIVRVTTEDPETREEIELYRAEIDQSRVLVAPYVAAEMTDLLQTAVATGTGRAAQIGRPVAGKTGTTSSNKDGWFVGFSSGLTTAVWMGRDDARAVAGLQGGRAPARAFADFMRYAVSSRPVEQFETEVTLPEWQLEDENDAYFGDPLDDEIFVDENGMPISDPGVYGEDRRYEDVVAPDTMTEDWLDEVLRRSEGDRRAEQRDSPAPPDDGNAPPAPAIRNQEEEPTQ